MMRSVKMLFRQSSQRRFCKQLPQTLGIAFHRNIETVPVIDISSLVQNGSEEQKYETSMSVGRALRELGFLYVVNHGIEQTLRDKVMENSVKFFALPQEKKLEIAQKDNSVRGYVNFGKEKTFKKADWKEAFYHMTEIDVASRKGPQTLLTGMNPWPKEDYVPGFEATYREYVAKLNELGQTMMSAIAVSLGFHKDFFRQNYISNPFTEMGMFHYPPYENSEDTENTEWAIGPHTDYGCLTLLSQCENGGLQVKATDGRWVDAPPRSDSFVVNACDMLEAWTNGACRSSPHRVKLPTKHRYSVVGFFGPSFDSHISPLPAKNLGNASFSTDFKFPIHYGEYIANKYAASYPTQVFDEMPCEERRIHGQRGTI